MPKLVFIALLISTFSVAANPYALPASERPEQDVINALLVQKQSPEGVLFVFADHDEEALTWFLPRLLNYAHQLRSKHPTIPLAVVSHGDEMYALRSGSINDHPEVVAGMIELQKLKIVFHVCGAFATTAGIDDDEFIESVDVVPFGPDQISDYRHLGFQVVSLEPTW